MTCCSGSLLTVKAYKKMTAMWPRNNEVLQNIGIYVATAFVLLWDQRVSGRLVDEWVQCDTRPKAAYLCNPRGVKRCGKTKQYVEKLVSKLLKFRFAS